MRDQAPEQVFKGIEFFGGSIMSAGLLTNHDIYRHFAQRKSKLDLLLLPGIIYDLFGNDLTGESYKKLEQKLQIRVEKI
jgi:hypothetical protein